MTKDEKRLNKLLQDYYYPEEDFSGVASDLLEYGDLKFIVHAHWKTVYVWRISWVVDGQEKVEAKRCSNCKKTLDWETPYCPFCGAQMDEKEGAQE
jgi:hypothetical protein